MAIILEVAVGGGGGGGGVCRQLFRTGGANKRKELQFGSRGIVWKGDMPPPAQSAGSKKIREV